MTALKFALPLLLLGMVFQCHAGGPFMDRGGKAVIDLVPPQAIAADEVKEDTRLVGSLLAVFLGPFGAHRLYLGTNARVAIIYGITFGGFGILPLIDLGHLLFTKDITRFADNGRVFMWRENPTPP